MCNRCKYDNHNPKKFGEFNDGYFDEIPIELLELTITE